MRVVAVLWRAIAQIIIAAITISAVISLSDSSASDHSMSGQMVFSIGLVAVDGLAIVLSMALWKSR
jgi:hypothetical protein